MLCCCHEGPSNRQENEANLLVISNCLKIVLRSNTIYFVMESMIRNFNVAIEGFKMHSKMRQICWYPLLVTKSFLEAKQIQTSEG